MTLILAAKGEDFVIMVGDSRAHSPKTGYYLDSMEKVFLYNKKMVVGGFGSEMFIRNLDYQFSRQLISKKSEKPTSFEEMMIDFQTLATNAWKRFTTSCINERRPSVGFIILGFTSDETPQIFEVFSENCFTPCIYTMSSVAFLGTDSIVTTFGEDLLRYAKSIADYKLAMVYLLWKTASRFSTVGMKNIRMVVGEKNDRFHSIEACEIDELVEASERIDKLFWKHFYQQK